MNFLPVWFGWLTLAILGPAFTSPASDPVYLTRTGTVHFVSEAPLELIEATSPVLRGVFAPTSRTFAFQVQMNSFEGFNDPLQREHFCEKFMACGQFPKALFKGRIVDLNDYTQPGTYDVRAKGTIEVHGIERERILPVRLTVSPDHIEVTSRFEVALEDHDIRVPRIVYQNIAEVIRVTVRAELRPLTERDAP